MKITFNIGYRTAWGESLYVSGDIPELGGGDPLKAVEMKPGTPGQWVLELNTVGDPGDFRYGYIVKARERAWRFEWGERHRFVAGKDIDKVDIFDSWQDQPSDKPYYSSAFTKGFMRRSIPDQPLRPQPGTINFRVSAPMVGPDETVAIVGEGNALGNWDPRKAIRLNDARFPVWETNIPAGGLKVPFEYKFIIIDSRTSEPRVWENCDNRIFGISLDEAGHSQTVVTGLRFANPRGGWRCSGTAVPVFSLRSDEDFGVGDFCDLKDAVDWVKETGQKVLQVLPINDTTKTMTRSDSYPYSANSSFALHPMYLRLQNVGRLKNRKRMAYYEELGHRLNEQPQVDYEAVNAAKMDYLREIYAEQGAADAKRADFKEFVAANEDWLRPYAAWRALRDEFQTPDSNLWGEYSVYDEKRVAEYCDSHPAETGLHFFIQYHLDRQLREARDHAHENGVVLKGDVPIGIGRHSADAWQHARLFNMDCQAGAPPDDFSVNGQNWGFPTYNWEEMARDGFSWWKARFRKMAEYFDAYRIDHILGFFRIWQIPLGQLHGLLGYFNPALPFTADELRNSYDFWIDPSGMTRPLIMDWMLGDFFGEYADDARREFLDEEGGGRFRLKPFVDDQRKVAEYFSSLEDTERNRRLRDALMGLIDDVLFIEDPYQPGHYHPRIAGQFTYQFRVLSDYAKWNFNRLYNDFFYHRHNAFWEGKAMWKLPPLIDATEMLCCAEDLGMIPDCVPDVMRNLEILSLEIQRMPKDPKAEFGDTWHYPYFSVCTTSTHDMPGIRAWWEQDRGKTQRYFNHVLHEGGEAPYFAEPWICEKILRLQLESPSMLCINPLQDWLAADGDLRRENPAEEQINEPADPNHYWRYRMHLTLRALRDADSFIAKMRELTSLR